MSALETDKMMETARGFAAQCWCRKDTQHIPMDNDLADAVSKQIVFWMKAAQKADKMKEYYLGLLDKCAEVIGDRAYVNRNNPSLRAVRYDKIPEILADDYGARGGAGKYE